MSRTYHIFTACIVEFSQLLASQYTDEHSMCLTSESMLYFIRSILNDIISFFFNCSVFIRKNVFPDKGIKNDRKNEGSSRKKLRICTVL